MTWSDLVWMKERMKVPLIVKGVATGEDAHLAVEHGADAVYVSNHGGRQLDHGQASIEVLPEVVEAVAGRAEVLVERRVTPLARGTDVIKAVALGAPAGSAEASGLGAWRQAARRASSACSSSSRSRSAPRWDSWASRRSRS